MAKKRGDDDDEIIPTPEQAQAYGEYARAAIALARFDKHCAGLPAVQLTSHTSEHGCVVLPSLGQSIALAEYGTQIGFALPPIHANWIEDLPIDFVAATQEELFFVLKGYTWLGTEILPMAISLGPLLSSGMLARLCNQEQVAFFGVHGPLISASEGIPMRKGKKSLVYQVPEGVEILKVRQHYEKLAHNSRTDSQHILETHFLG